MKVRALLATAALLLGGGGTALVAADASAGGTHRPAAGGAQEQAAATATTIACPDVGDRLQDVPAPARQQVSAGLAELDAQIARAYEKAAAPGGDSGAVLGEL
ncbi:hypothetical protein BLA24_09760, partial [Streptomyces cinnamoneus]